MANTLILSTGHALNTNIDLHVTSKDRRVSLHHIPNYKFVKKYSSIGSKGAPHKRCRSRMRVRRQAS